MLITLPEPCLVLLVGPSGSGKSTFAQRHFRPTEILSSDFCRALVCDQAADQSATDDAFEVLHLLLAKRLNRGRTTVLDATNVQSSARKPLIEAARTRDVPVSAILFMLSEDICQQRNQNRLLRQVSCEVIKMQMALLAESLAQFDSEGIHRVFELKTPDEAEAVTIVREPRAASYS